MSGWTEADVHAVMARRRPTMPQNRRSKYGATPTMVDGIRFHSAKEAHRYGELRLLLRAGTIFRLELQPVYRLCAWRPAFKGEPILIGHYVADFRYCYRADCVCAWGCVIEDVKGMKTPLYTWKKKHVEAQYNITIHEL